LTRKRKKARPLPTEKRKRHFSWGKRKKGGTHMEKKKEKGREVLSPAEQREEKKPLFVRRERKGASDVLWGKKGGDESSTTAPLTKTRPGKGKTAYFKRKKKDGASGDRKGTPLTR